MSEQPGRSEPQDDSPHAAPAPDPNATRDLFGEGASPQARFIGRYHIRRVIARSGMGIVYEALQDHPRRAVALKVLRPDVATPSTLRRFEQESQILASLRHPGIAQVYEAGTNEDVGGRVPYFVMEYIPEARPINRYADQRRLSTRDRLELFLEVCDAVHFGHTKGVIHRDLKPGNILVDGQGRVKVIDFGVARTTDSDLAAATQQTQVGDLVGTLRYMSPEQCEADPHALDARSDVYALGIVLYELLSGAFPYDLDSTPVYEAPRVIREVPPTPLSRVNRALRGDLETIVGKALEKVPERRYQSTLALADDIRRYIRSEPILARPASGVYRLRKFVRRRRVPLAMVVLLLSAAAVATYFQVQARRAFRQLAIAQADANTLTWAFLLQGGRMLGATSEETARMRADCTKAIERSPQSALPYAVRGKVFQLQRRYDRAWDDSRKALDLDPQQSLALGTIGFLLLGQGNFPASREAYDKAIRFGSGRPEDFHNRARLHRLAGNYQLALQDHERAIALAPQEGLVYQGRALTRRFSGDAQGALEDLSKAASLDRNLANQYNLWIWEIGMLAGDPQLVPVAEKGLDAAQETATDDFDRRIVDMCRGTVTPQDILDSVGNPLRVAMVDYYAGAKALIDGDRVQAIKWFQAYPDKFHDHLEFDLAKWHLRRLGGN